MKQTWATIIVSIGLLVLMPAAGFACSVPVFRYALERWAADYYEAALIHRGELTEDQKQLLNELRQEDSEAETFLNLRLLEVDIATTTDEELKSLLMSEELPETLPVLALWYPWHRGRTPPVWQGELAPSTVADFLQSPTRKKLVERLTDGQTAVWIFVESGDAEKDKAALALLEEQLETATRELKEQAEAIPEEYAMPGVKYEFSILSVSRSDPSERLLMSLLMNSEPDLDEYSDEPMIFPVFGRGRVLFALVGEGINADNILETVSFLVGPCGCEIKAMNPGVDLLVSANWDQALMELYEEFYAVAEPMPELTSVFAEEPLASPNEVPDVLALPEAADTNDVTDVVAVEPDDEPFETAAAAEQKPRGLGVMGTTAVSLAGILVLVALGTLAVSRRRKANQ